MKVVLSIQKIMKQAPLSVVLGATVFFWRLTNRISENYPELFSEGTNGNAGGFAKKWGSYSEAVTLATDEVQRIIGVPLGTPVSKYPLHACYLYLAYIKEKTELRK